MPAGVATPPVARAAALVVDVNGLEAEISFWSALLGLAVGHRERDWADLARLGTTGPVLSLQRVPERKRHKNRLHLDLVVGDFQAAARRAHELGATAAGPVQATDTATPWQVFRDPEGNEFCLCTADPAG